MTWTVRIEQDEDDGVIVPLPDGLLAQFVARIGDSPYLTEEYVGTTRRLVLSKTPRVPEESEHRDNQGAGLRDE